jgi:hypothetical protein
MRLSVISWNIRHLRKEKIETHQTQVVKDLADGHVVFLYENKMDHSDNGEMYDLLMDALGEAHGNSEDIAISALSVPVGTNEYVQVVYTSRRVTGPNSQHGPGQAIDIEVSKNTTWNRRLWDEGWNRLSRSYNNTVLSEISQQRLAKGKGYRIPAIVDVVITKPDASRRTITIAAWHAPGPAKATAPSLFEAYCGVLTDIDLLVGDFNYNPNTRFSPAKQVGKLSLESVLGSTTINEKAEPTNHTAGPDLIYYNKEKVSSMAFQTRKALIGNVEVREGDVALGKVLWDLSDHRPVVLTLKNL